MNSLNDVLEVLKSYQIDLEMLKDTCCFSSIELSWAELKKKEQEVNDAIKFLTKELEDSKK